MLYFTKSAQANIFFIVSTNQTCIKLKPVKEQNEKYPINIGVIGEAIKNGVEIFNKNITDSPKFNSSIDINSSLAVNTYPLKDSKGSVLIVVQCLKYNGITGKKSKKNTNEDEINEMFFKFMVVFYEKNKEKILS